MGIANGEFSSKQRIDIIKQFCASSNIDIIQIKEDKTISFVEFDVLINAQVFKLFLYLKNIVNSGWSNKPYIKRIQIKAFDTIPENKNGKICALVGICNGTNGPIVAFWNPFLYTFHKKNRSGYLLVEQLEEADNNGFLETEYADKKILICSSTSFYKLLTKYVEKNYID